MEEGNHEVIGATSSPQLDRNSEPIREHTVQGYATSYPSLDSGLPSSEFRTRASRIDEKFLFLAKNLDAKKILEIMDDFLSPNDKEMLQKSKDERVLAKSLLQLVKQHISTKFYDRFLKALSQTQPKIYEEITETRATGNTETSSIDTEQGASASPQMSPNHLEQGYLNCMAPRITGAAGFNTERGDTQLKIIAHGTEVESGSTDSDRDQDDPVGGRIPPTSGTIQNAMGGFVDVIKCMKPCLQARDVDSLCRELEQQQSLSGMHFDGKLLTEQNKTNILEHLISIRTLDELSFVGFGWMECHLSPLTSILRGNKNLCQINLDQCKFSLTDFQKLLSPLQYMTKLNYLSLNATCMGDEGVRIISQALMNKTNLKRFSLNRNQISDLGVKHLAECLQNKLQLEYLSLASNQISDVGCEYLAKSNLRLHQSCYFNLADNQIGSSGAMSILTNFVAPFGKKHSFNFDKNQIDDELVSENKCSILENSFGSKRVAFLVRRLSRGESFHTIHLKRMKLKDCDIETLCLPLCVNGKLKMLNLADNSLTDKSLKFLTQLYHTCENLICVNLENNKFSDSALVHSFTKNLGAIRERQIKGPYFLTRAFWDNVEGARDKVLHIENLQHSGYNIPILFGMIDAEPLREIKIENCELSKKDVNKINKHIFKFPNAIETLHYARNNFAFEVMKAVGFGFLKEQRFMLFGRWAEDFPTKINGLALKKIVLSGNGITHSGIKFYARTIFKCPSLNHLNLQNNKFGELGTKHLTKYLEDSPPLVSLELAGNNIGTIGLYYLSKGLSQNRTVKHLGLANNGIDSKGAVYLSEILSTNIPLEYLDLNDNSLGNAGAEFRIFCNRVRTKESMTTLKMRSNSINDNAGKNLANSLTQNKSICKIDISKNYLNTEYMIVIFIALSNGQISHLDISEISSDNIVRLCEYSQCASLSYLGLRSTRINGEQIKQIALALSQSQQTRSFQNTGEKTILDLSGIPNIRERTTSLAYVRENCKSVRCIFDNENGNLDFFDSPFK